MSLFSHKMRKVTTDILHDFMHLQYMELLWHLKIQMLYLSNKLWVQILNIEDLLGFLWERLQTIIILLLHHFTIYTVKTRERQNMRLYCTVVSQFKITH